MPWTPHRRSQMHQLQGAVQNVTRQRLVDIAVRSILANVWCVAKASISRVIWFDTSVSILERNHSAVNCAVVISLWSLRSTVTAKLMALVRFDTVVEFRYLTIRQSACKFNKSVLSLFRQLLTWCYLHLLLSASTCSMVLEAIDQYLLPTWHSAGNILATVAADNQWDKQMDGRTDTLGVDPVLHTVSTVSVKCYILQSFSTCAP